MSEAITRAMKKAKVQPSRPWLRHFTKFCRRSLPEDRALLVKMAAEIEAAIQRIGGDK